jgi:hypothetical protein
METLNGKIVRTGDFKYNEGWDIHPVSNSQELFDVHRLTHDSCVAKGLIKSRLDGLWVPHPDFDLIPQTTILVASIESEVVGSISFTKDGSRGLIADTIFKKTCSLIRTENRSMAEIWRLVLKPSFSEREKVAEALMQTAARSLIAEGSQTCLLSIYPEYIALCERLLNVVVLTGTNSVHGLPSFQTVFMRSDLETLAKHSHGKSLSRAS